MNDKIHENLLKNLGLKLYEKVELLRALYSHLLKLSTH